MFRVLVLAIAIAASLISTSAEARRHYHVRHGHVQNHHRSWHHRHHHQHFVPDGIYPVGGRSGGNLVTVQTAAGKVTVSATYAEKFKGFIADVVSLGFRGPVHCYSRGGHVPGSLHYSGQACDFAQTGWNRTHRVMYHIGHVASKWGLRDGCTFHYPRRDCGHIDSGRPLTHYAHYSPSAKRQRTIINNNPEFPFANREAIAR